MNEISFGHKILFFLPEVDRLVENKFQMPVSFEIDASNACQNDCDFCMFAFHIKKNRVHLNMDLYRKTIWDFTRHGIKSITFTGGGEPLMHPNIRDMIELADHLDIKVGVVSNGIFLDKIQEISNKLEYVRISLDSASPDTYKRTKHTSYFGQIVENAKRLVDARSTHVGLSFVITDENRDEIDAFYSLAKSIGVHYAQVKPEIRKCDMESQTEGLDRSKFFVTERYNIDENSMTACRIAGLIGVLNATGKVYYCCIHRGKPQFELGDLNHQSLHEIYSKWRPHFKPNLKMCGGSCRYMNYAKVYENCRGNRFIPLRHRRLI
jgi:MoaA/NifB/PqqE/SkfB family radical SAM enzyme